MQRGQWKQRGTSSWDEGEIEITSTEKHLLIEITQEHAVDSYNVTFTCSVKLWPSDVDRLIAWLQEMRK